MVLVDQPIQRTPADAEHLGSMDLVPFFLAKYFLNVPALDIAEQPGVRVASSCYRATHLYQAFGQIVERDRVFLGQDLGSLEHVGQFADVAGPVVTSQDRQRLRLDAVAS